MQRRKGDAPQEEPTRPSHDSRRTVLEQGRRWLGLPVGPTLTGTGFESTRYLARWLFLSSAIGIVAGLGAIAFYVAIGWATDLFLGRLVGYLPPSPAGEGSTGVLPMARPWLLPLVVGLGGLISGVIVFSLAPEAEGHGTDAAIEAIHHRQGRIRARIPPIKLIASALTIGSGGSGGREGPAAQISAGFGSLLGDWLNLAPRDRRVAVAAGMGAGIGAIFRAPLGGAVLAAEILYLHDLEVEALVPALIASIVGYTVYGAYFGFTPIFGAQPELALGSPIQLLYYALLGLACGLVGILYARTFYGLTAVFRRLGPPRWVKPALGGVLVGAMGLLIPGSLGMGYGWVQVGMSQELLGLPLWMVLALPFAKILATALSIGSGGSGGVFGPGMVIGGMLGASFWRLGHEALPALPPTPAPFVIVGMMALFGGIAHAPLAVMLMVAEMTGNLSLLAPAMVAVGVSTALVGDHSIYHSQLPNRASSPFHRIRFSFPLLSSLLVRDAMRRGEPRPAAGAPDAAVRLAPDAPLDEALDNLAQSGATSALVVERGAVVGQVSTRDIVARYKQALDNRMHRASALPRGTSLFEASLGADSPLVSRPLRSAGLPPGVLVVSINRGGEIVFPTADTTLQKGDVILLLADPARESALASCFEGAVRARAE